MGEAQAMFKEYKARFREEEREQSEAMSDESADLGEAGPDMPSLPSPSRSEAASDQMATLDKPEASISAPVQKHKISRQRKTTVAQKASSQDPEALVEAARAAVGELLVNQGSHF